MKGWIVAILVIGYFTTQLGVSLGSDMKRSVQTKHERILEKY